MKDFGKLENYTQCDICFRSPIPCITIQTDGYDPNAICVCKECLNELIKKLERYE